MKRCILLLAFLGTPAFAHHEVVVATSMMPLMGGLVVILLAAVSAGRQGLRKRLTRRRELAGD